MKNYLVIGGSSGIGKALVKQLTEAGNQVYATYCKNNINEQLPNLNIQQMDVVEENINLTLPEIIHGFAYCPGSIQLKPFKNFTPNDFIQDYQLQVIGSIKVLQHILPNLKAASQAAVVFFSTVAVQTGFNFHAQVAASKGAIEGLTKALAAELAPRIRVNAIAPSITQTPLAAKFLSTEEKITANAKRHPLKTIGQAKDIANIAQFLLSEQAAWITGQIIGVDGGISTLRT